MSVIVMNASLKSAPAPLRAVIYARVSSLAQKDKLTIASQLSVLPTYVAHQGWSLVRPPTTYVDDGRTAKSGHLDKRDGWQRLRRDMTAGLFDVVVVVDQDRLTRSEDLTERGEILGAFQRAGVKIGIASTGQLLDLGSSIGELLSTLGGYFSAEENRKRRERGVRGKVEAARKGKKPAGPTPFGYLYDRLTGVWSVDPELGPIVHEIFHRTATAETMASIARDLALRGVPRARPSKTGRRKPGKWILERVWQIVHSMTYRGEWIADKAKDLRMPVPRIVSDELWGAAHDALKRHGLRGIKKTRRVYVAGGVAKCGLCGGAMGASSAMSGARDRRRHYYYICTNRRRPQDGQPRCMLPMQRADKIDERVWQAVVELLMKPGHVERLLAGRKSSAARSKEDTKAELKAIERRLAKLDRDEADVIQRYRREMISARVFDSVLQEMAAERVQLSRQVETSTRLSADAHVLNAEASALADRLADLRRRVSNATVEERRDVVRALVPGRGDYWIVLGAKKAEMHVLVAAEPVAPHDRAGCSSSEMCNRENVLSIRLVA